MKLTATQLSAAEAQLESVPISESVAFVPELKIMFGDHTFFVDSEGLHILEWFEEDQPSDGREALTAVRIAAWTGDDQETVAAHPPAKTNLVVITGDDRGGDAA